MFSKTFCKFIKVKQKHSLNFLFLISFYSKIFLKITIKSCYYYIDNYLIKICKSTISVDIISTKNSIKSIKFKWF